MAWTKVIANISDELRAAQEVETSATDSAKDLAENNFVKGSGNGPAKDSVNVLGVDFACEPAMGWEHGLGMEVVVGLEDGQYSAMPR